MKARTINISLPESLYKEAKKHQVNYHYSALSELIRDALRWWLNPRLTRNGFTPEFEQEVLEAAAEPVEDSIEWDGKGSFVDFVLSHPVKSHAKRSAHRKIQQKLAKSGFRDPDDWDSGGAASQMVSQKSRRHAAP